MQNTTRGMFRNPIFRKLLQVLEAAVERLKIAGANLLVLHRRQEICCAETGAAMTSAKRMPWQQESLWRSWESNTYGNLCRILVEPSMAVLHGWEGEYGWDGWLGTYLCNSLIKDVTFLLFTQRIDAGTLVVTRELRNVLTSEL